MRPNTRAFVRYRCRTVNHREITGVYDGNYYISRGEMYATLFLDTLRLSSQVNRSMLEISRHDAIGRSSVFASCYCDRLSLLKSNRFLRHVYILSVYLCRSNSTVRFCSMGEKEDRILSHLRQEEVAIARS